jgi:hypothetical protein
VRCLQCDEVRDVFGVPREETREVNDALARSSITFVPVRHEQAAAFMSCWRGVRVRERDDHGGEGSARWTTSRPTGTPDS